MRDYSSCLVVSKSNLSTISFFHLTSTDFIQDEGLDQVSIQPYNQPLPTNFKNFLDFRVSQNNCPLLW